MASLAIPSSRNKNKNNKKKKKRHKTLQEICIDLNQTKTEDLPDYNSKSTTTLYNIRNEGKQRYIRTPLILKYIVDNPNDEFIVIATPDPSKRTADNKWMYERVSIGLKTSSELYKKIYAVLNSFDTSLAEGFKHLKCIGFIQPIKLLNLRINDISNIKLMDEKQYIKDGKEISVYTNELQNWRGCLPLIQKRARGTRLEIIVYGAYLDQHDKVFKPLFLLKNLEFYQSELPELRRVSSGEEQISSNDDDDSSSVSSE